MYLEGQANRSSAAVSERGLPAEAEAEAGFALAALLVAIAVLSIMMLVVLPTWRHQAQREKEAELVFRGEQYARAIGLYQRKLAGSFPPSLDILVEQKFLRKKYKDPISGEDFVPIYANSAAGTQAMRQSVETSGGAVRVEMTTGPDGRGRVSASFQGSATGQRPGGAPPSQGPAPGMPPPAGPVTPGAAGRGRAGGASGLSGAAGGIVGVTSKSKDQSIRLYNGRDRYDQWIFTYIAASPQAGQTVGPGQQPPGRGQAPGLPQRGTGSGRGRGSS